MRRLILPGLAAVCAVVALTLAPGIGANSAVVAIGHSESSVSATAPLPTITVTTSWAGYGLRSAPGTLLSSVQGTWIVPKVSCPTTSTLPHYGLASEAIGVGLNAYPTGGKLDGVGTLTVCVLQTPIYYAWYDEASPLVKSNAVLVRGFVVNPGDIMSANITCSSSACNYSLTDWTPPGESYNVTWAYPTAPLTAEPKFNLAECVVMRGPMLGLLPNVFGPLPPSATTAGNAQFGSYFTSATEYGCAVNVFTGFGAPGPGMGLINFRLPNAYEGTPTVTLVPSAIFLTGLDTKDSFTVQ